MILSVKGLAFDYPSRSVIKNINFSISKGDFLLEQFKDVDPGKKADEIYKCLLGKELYAEMAKAYSGFKKLTLKQTEFGKGVVGQ